MKAKQRHATYLVGHHLTRKGTAMKQICCVAVILIASSLLPTMAQAQKLSPTGTSFGLVVGDPTGLSLRSGMDGGHAVQAHLGFSPFPGDALTLMVDWTYDAWNFLDQNSGAALLLYWGGGFKLAWFTGGHYLYHRSYGPEGGHFGLGVRGLAGLRLAFKQAPIDLFLELAPLGLIFVVTDPGVYYDVDMALGLRYRF